MLYICNNKTTKDMQEEIFKDIPGYEGHYQVSNLGKVVSLKKGIKLILRPSFASNRYHKVDLYKNNIREIFYIHKLVGIVFLGYNNLFTDKIIDHIDGNTLNNNLDNLQIISQRENVSRAFKNKKTSSKYTGVYFVKKRNEWIARIRFN